MSAVVHTSDPGLTSGGTVRGKGSAQKTYEANGFNAAKEDKQLSYTPARVATPVFNTYRTGSCRVAGFVDTDAFRDSRLGATADDPKVDYSRGGKGGDLTVIPADAYDELIVDGVGIIGDAGTRERAIKDAALAFKIASSEKDLTAQMGKAVFTDPQGHVLAGLGYGFDEALSGQPADVASQAKAQGLLGAVAAKKKANPNLTVGLHVGGWQMSAAFHYMAKEPADRARFADSLARIFEAFPMFTTLHLGWQFPGAAGATENTYGPEDPENYAKLIREVKAKLDPLVSGGVTIAIAVAGTVDKIREANIPLLVEAGVARLNLHAYDYFGSPWAPGLTHHANLRRDPNAPDQPSVDDVVQYLTGELNVDSRKIHLAYVTDTRNAQQAAIMGTSPLKGEYAPEEPTVGSFESGSSVYPDVLANYLDLEKKEGRNGFTLYTDTKSDADFLYNDDSAVFLSLETPRSVKSKAQYVVEHNLGGLFTPSAGVESGVLLNAAREGLGSELTKKTIDMTPLYFSGR